MKKTRQVRKTFPDDVAADVVRRGSSKGSIRNYWPPSVPLSPAARRRIWRYEKATHKCNGDPRHLCMLHLLT